MMIHKKENWWGRIADYVTAEKDSFQTPQVASQ
jgi:hypothetical protein